MYWTAGVYLSEAPYPPPVTNCMNKYPCTYSHREHREGGEVNQCEG
jgi:hypothetical protein